MILFFFSLKGSKAVFLLKSIITIHQKYLFFFFVPMRVVCELRQGRKRLSVPLIHLFIYLCVQGTALGTKDTAVNVKQTKIPTLLELSF